METSSLTHEANSKKFPQESLQLFSGLPDEILIEILLRLPVKLLLKFRSISKSWLYLLSSPYFIRTQVSISNKKCKNLNHRLAIVASVKGLGKIYPVYSVVCETSSLKVAKFDHQLKIPIGSKRFLGSCNGLVCLATLSLEMILWNPSTGKCKEFQDSSVQSPESCYTRYGFGYEGSNDDYKVVKIISSNKNEGKYENMVSVYSLRADSWKMIEGFESGYINGQVGVFVSGSLHWEVLELRSHDSSASSKVMALDLEREVYGKKALPDGGVGEFSRMLRALDGRLAACYNYYQDRMDVWVMKEYGVEKSWTKLVSVSSPVNCWGSVHPLFASENGDEVLVNWESTLSLYNSTNGSYKSMEIHESGVRLLQVVTYIESLASPHLC